MIARFWISVSIHAPVMDANLNGVLLLLLSGFNPRARDGREIGTVTILVRHFLFQSTRP